MLVPQTPTWDNSRRNAHSMKIRGCVSFGETRNHYCGKNLTLKQAENPKGLNSGRECCNARDKTTAIYSSLGCSLTIKGCHVSCVSTSAQRQNEWAVLEVPQHFIPPNPLLVAPVMSFVRDHKQSKRM
eukprot:2816785-Amphidinium_carterae.2